MSALLSIVDSGLNHFAKATYQPYHQALKRCLRQQGHLTIAVIGANDGKINDPVYDFAMAYRAETAMVLIEPQADLHKPLRTHYADHPHATVIKGAVGATGQFSLYTIDPKHWPRTQPFYAKAWPLYRAPSGVASMDKARVVEWLRRFVDITEDEGVIETEIEVRPLADWCEGCGIAPRFDVLQIDTEGVDDEVIYHSDLETTRPSVLYFESKNLERHRLKRLKSYLKGLGYRCQRILGNTLAEGG